MSAPLRPYRVHFGGCDIETLATDPDDAERRTRYVVSDCGWDSDPIGVADRGEAWSVVDLIEFPDEGFCVDCGRALDTDGGPPTCLACRDAAKRALSV